MEMCACLNCTPIFVWPTGVVATHFYTILVKIHTWNEAANHAKLHCLLWLRTVCRGQWVVSNLFCWNQWKITQKCFTISMGSNGAALNNFCWRRAEIFEANCGRCRAVLKARNAIEALLIGASQNLLPRRQNACYGHRKYIIYATTHAMSIKWRLETNQIRLKNQNLIRGFNNVDHLLCTHHQRRYVHCLNAHSLPWQVQKITGECTLC